MRQKAGACSCCCIWTCHLAETFLTPSVKQTEPTEIISHCSVLWIMKDFQSRNVSSHFHGSLSLSSSTINRCIMDNTDKIADTTQALPRIMWMRNEISRKVNIILGPQHTKLWFLHSETGRGGSKCPAPLSLFTRLSPPGLSSQTLTGNGFSPHPLQCPGPS